MPCSSHPNKESARAHTQIFVWRQSLRVGARADGTDPYGKSEPLYGARGAPHRRRVLLLREAVDERRCRDEVGVGTFVEAAAAYRPDPGCPDCGAGGAPGGTGPLWPGSRGRAADAAAGGSPPSRAQSSRTAASRLPPWLPSSGSCATTSPSSARLSCSASPTRRPSSVGIVCSPRCPATGTESCRATPPGLMRPTSTQADLSKSS